MFETNKRKYRDRNTFVRKMGIVLLSSFLLSGCVNELKVSTAAKKQNTFVGALNVTVSNVEVINNQLVITGTNLDKVDTFKIQEGAVVQNMAIETKSSTQIIANTLSNVTFAAGKIMDFVFSNAQAASSFSVNFSLCDSTLGGRGFNCTATPLNGHVLAFDGASNKWVPKAINGLTYKGAWDPTPGTFPTGAMSGDYYIASDDANGYFIGDWIVYNGSAYDHISNSNAMVSVFGRTGAVVAMEGDYNLDKLADVDLSVSPVTNQVLKYNGTRWVAGNATYTETDPTVSAFAKTALPTCSASEVLSSDGTSLGCVTDQAGAGTFTGTANRIVTTDSGGALAVTSISDTVLGYMSGVTSNVQTQLNAKANSSAIVDWSAAGATPTIDPSRLVLATAGRAVVTSGSGVISTSAVTATELGHLSGVTSAIQTQLDSKISGTLPTCTSGQVLYANGSVLSCVTDAGDGKADITNIAQTITALTVTGLQAPSAGSDAVNKTYVDARTTQWTTATNDIYFTTAATGKVGVGTSSPNSKLEVANGSITTAYSAISSLTADFSTANVISTTAAAGTLVLSNMRDGTSYTLIVQNTGSYVLSGSSVTSWRCAPACTSNTISNTSGHVLITVLKAGTTAYVSYIGDM